MNLELHHIGVATKNIEKEFAIFQKLGYKKVSDMFSDEIQKIKGVFIETDNQPRLELLENLEENGPLDSCLKNGTKFYHLAYKTNDIQKDSDELIKEVRAKLIVPITEATYFDKICFLMLPNMTLIELVQER
jgi:methylmalonyl-CoA/ethylmalonyl-CoA epimerase